MIIITENEYRQSIDKLNDILLGHYYNNLVINIRSVNNTINKLNNIELTDKICTFTETVISYCNYIKFNKNLELCINVSFAYKSHIESNYQIIALMEIKYQPVKSNSSICYINSINYRKM